MEKEPVIELKNVYKSFGTKYVLRGLDLSIYKGESIVLLGQSGMGKSVSVRLMLGLMDVDSGSIKINGKEITNFSEEEFYENNRKIGMLFQNGALFDSMSVWENIAFSLLNIDKMNPEEARKIAIQKLEDVGLPSKVADMMPDELSGGMRKRVGLARAIADNPNIIFFDEPTTGLDPIMSDVINNLIVRCVKQLGATALTITHDINSARKIADRIVMLYDGKIIWSGKPSDLDNPKNEYVEHFVKGISL
ncbi:MAG: ABC transporter ATP-binding protein [Alphaproteobacteria bacterium]|nr:ABC transporter ATP-binding protein [Alphaproteobacteria bacterium]MBQ8660456.1 ABC transporter ATP-binding protein [Alphaproteobacteria bacterium]